MGGRNKVSKKKHKHVEKRIACVSHHRESHRIAEKGVNGQGWKFLKDVDVVIDPSLPLVVVDFALPFNGLDAPHTRVLFMMWRN